MRRWFALAVLALGVAAASARTPIVPPAAKAERIVRSFVQALQIEKGTTYRNMTVYPVVWKGDMPGTITTLDRAVESKQLVVSEIGSGRVNELYVENVGKSPVFIMAGEILIGAKQNRVLQNDVLVPPDSGKVSIAAFCVEEDRWSYQGPASAPQTFTSGGFVSNPSVRAVAQERKDQSSVWSEVENTHRKLGVAAPTKNLDEVYKSRPVQTDLSQYVKAFDGLPSQYPGMRGAVVVVGGKILVADVFADRGVMQPLWDKLVRSYALEAVRDGATGTLTEDAAAAFVGRALEARYEMMNTPGAGQLVEIIASNVSGSALVYQNLPLHLSLFPRSGAPVPVPRYTPDLQRPYNR